MPAYLQDVSPPARLAAVGGAVAGTLLLAWLTAWLLVGDGVPRGTQVLGADIGGMSPAAAEQTLKRELADRAESPLTVDVSDQKAKLEPKAVGLALDTSATVAEASDRPLNPVALLSMLFGDQRVTPTVRVDKQVMGERLAAVAKRADRPARDGDVRFVDGEAQAVQPQEGQVVDVAAAGQVLRQAYLRDDEVRLPTKTSQPEVSRAEVRRAMTEFAEPAMSDSIVLEVGDGTLELEPTDLDDHLGMRPDAKDPGRLVPHVAGKDLREALASQLAPYEGEPRDARFEVVGGSPRVIPAQLGRTAKPDELGRSVLAALESGSRRAPVELSRAEPELTTEKAHQLGITERVSTYTTSYPYAAYRLQNIHRAADLIDGTVVMPGDSFSLNDEVGQRTAENGFAKGTIIQDGRFFEDYGGGVSQLATTTFNAVFFAGLEDVQHQPHSFYISRYPEGREATVVWPVVDMEFRNDSPNGILVDTSYTDSTVTVTLWGTKRYEITSSDSGRYNVRPYKTIHDDSKTCVDQIGVRGFDIKVYRHFLQNGQEVKTETFKTHYEPADEIHCEPPPKPSDEPTSSPSGGGGGGGSGGGDSSGGGPILGG
ncbi:MAG: VanW family protein [Actinomycetes bacterium]